MGESSSDYSEEPTDDCQCGGGFPEWDYHSSDVCAVSKTAASAYF